ncbi:Acetyl-CoA synthetase-like protein [Venustampulla echinocandica]|uniref:Acetyl-CoA synthetase-like protein n=1 Tax=Venustampulla echinocandica TaxID=2656787 RepID=A0A370TLF7_9HELO|nr:Acetyl-CoA synthetase-like protein [Venustampulla echinocandica]RDL36366.1 Acetyl-CoA synthetase-like protein [Venustampulla echinocandica]
MASVNMPVPRELWKHPNPESTEMYKMMQQINQKHNLNLNTFWELYQYSISNRAQFWDQCFQSLDIIHSGSYKQVVDESASIETIPRWFEGVSLNFAENMLYSRVPGASTSERGTIGKEDEKIAVTEVREGATEIRHVSWGQLRKEVAELTVAMKAHGVKKGDRVVVVASNSVDTLKVFLAITTLGGLFSSSSTDMGVSGVLQRTTQVTPKYIFMDDFAIYNGKKVDLRQKMSEVVRGMDNLPEFSGMISMPRFSQPADISHVPQTRTLASFLEVAKGSASSVPAFEQVAFRDPFFIAYSSGTTGTPKCIVHSVGGCLANSTKEGKLHGEIGPESVVLQYTTTGWIMYLASVANLIAGARVVLYDGSPFQPDLTTFVKLTGDQKVTKLGTSPKWMHELQKNGISPRDIADLSSLKAVCSTGMVLSDQLFEWFYDVGFPKHVHLANISGGTDLAGCFGIENPLSPVYVGGTQGPSLGTPVSIYDSTIASGYGQQISDGEAGELIAPQAFPNMPVYFWNDPFQSPHSSSRYFQAYFAKYTSVWTHGDFAAIHPITKQLLFLGRADGVLNPSGVRFGSAEIYGVLESGQFPGVADSICVGQRREGDADESVMLFLLMRGGHKFTESLVRDVKTAIGSQLSKRHVPKYIFETPDIPTTVNLKKVELPVKHIVSGKIVKPSGTLLNPKSLEYYYQFAKVEEFLNRSEIKSKL